MRIGIDLDDTLAELQKGWIRYFNKKHGTSYIFEDATDYKFSYIQDFQTDEILRIMKEFFETKEFEKLNTVFGSVEAIGKISKKHELYVISSRDISILDKSEKWITKNFPNKFKDIIHTGQFTEKSGLTKSQVCLDNQIDVMIEDALHHAEELSKNKVKVLLLDKPWNREPYDGNTIQRMVSWKEVAKTIKHL